MKWIASCFVLLLTLSAASAIAAPPVIEEVQVDRGMDTNSWGMTFYHQRLDITVTATEPETVACVIIVDPFGHRWVISVCAGGGWPEWDGWWEEPEVITMGEINWWVTEDAGHTVHCGMANLDLTIPPPAGTYTISVSNNYDANVVELTTPPAPAIEDTIATVGSPPPDSIVADSTPTFRWTNGAPDAENTLLVREEGRTQWSGWPADDSGAVWSADVGSATQAIYNFDGTALRPELEPGRSYFWRVESWFPEDDFVTDPRVSIWTSHYANGRFTINTTWPELPDLPGKICYGGAMWGDWGYDPDSYSMWLYSTDLANREWLGPETAAPGDWSPDGVKLLYHPSDKGAWIDPGDGSLPYRIPNIDPWGDTRWSPDATELVYKELTQDGLSPYEIRIADIDGTNVRAIAGSFDTELTYPSWSPQGDWISYVDDADPNGQGVWLVRPDGTDRHALTVTEITGYPGVELDGMNEPSWSPDGGSLAVSFVAGFAGWGTADALWGIGVIGRNGGAIRPVFVGPSGYACCAAPRFPVWSPTGTKIAFTSAHHLPLNPDWYSTYTYEPGSEIWLINADGSGEPVRLTYDFIFDWVGSWWAPPTFTDVERGFWAVCAVNACYEAGVVAGYEDGTYKPELPVTRDQMAVYISRALAGGDDNVPDFTDTPTFPDVPEDNWALDYIEYAVEQAVVTGYDDGYYHPEYEVSRDQMAVYVARTLVAPTGEAALTDYVPADPRNFPDVPDTFWAYRHIEYCVEHGVVNGYDDGLYHPEITVTRDQMAVYVARAFGL
jgi:hypothetical protein